MTLPTTPQAWAIHLTRLLNAVYVAHGTNRFPIDITEIARDYSHQVYPDEPITRVEGIDLSTFEGALTPRPHSKEWGIFYNRSIESPGRRNFTLAHEFGHYLLHRLNHPEGFQCSSKDMAAWDSEYGQMESQANTFASFLLMPLDDFRGQIHGQSPSLELMAHLANRYNVSLSAAILKWLGITDKRAMVVVGKDGFIDWSWASRSLLKIGIFYRARQETIEIPPTSLAGMMNPALDNKQGMIHPSGVWPGNEEVHEMTILGKARDLTISLLIYPDQAKRQVDLEDPEPIDTYDLMVQNLKR